MIKKLGKCIGEYKKPSILSPIFISLEVLMEVLIPLMMASLINNGIEKNDFPYVIKIGVLLLISATVSLIFGALSGKYAAEASAGFAKNLRKKMFYNVQTYAFSNIDKFSASSIVTRLTTDVTNLQNAYQMIIRTVVRSPFMLIASLIFSFVISPKMTGIFLCIIPILGVGLYFIISHAHPIFKWIFSAYDVLTRIVQENIRGIRVVKSFVREEHEKEKFNDMSEKIYKKFSLAEKILAFNSPLMQFSIYSCIILISYVGAKIIVSSGGKALGVGDISALMSYAMQILMSLMMFSMVLVMVTMAKASAERIEEIIDEESAVSNPTSSVMNVKNGDISFENVSFSYKNNNNYCLKNINLSIKSGETVGIIGGTGSSKSTLVQLIPRLYDVSEGSVKVGDIDVRKYDIEVLREAVSMVLQKNVLFSGTIKENLRWGDPNATDKDIERVCRLSQADEFIQKFPDKYDTYIEQGGANVSGGQKQRLCIARALIKKPKILILDDSTSAVDTRTDALIREAFKSEIPDTTKIIIAQRISSVENSDKIIVLDGGEINAIGTHDELLKTNEIYKEVYYSQLKGGDDDARN